MHIWNLKHMRIPNEEEELVSDSRHLDTGGRNGVSIPFDSMKQRDHGRAKGWVGIIAARFRTNKNEMPQGCLSL